jgi:hypothetical protein
MGDDDDTVIDVNETLIETESATVDFVDETEIAEPANDNESK